VDEALLRHCECLGIGITFIIWNGIALPGFSFGLIDAAMATYNITIEQSIQSGSDGLHNSRFFTRYVPLRGTFFEAGPWGDPDGNLRFRRGGFARWGGVYPRLDREAELRLPIVLGGGIASAADLYLRDVASVFDGREGFLSYDLINEPEAWADSNGRMLPSAFELMTATYDVLRAAHSLTPPDFTVGVASSAMLVPVYNTLRASGRPMTYASFHDYSPRMYTGTSFYDELSRFRTQIGGLPLVCSEFYSPYHNPGSAWAHARGHLGEIARNLKAYGIGGQIWNVLEQNFFRVPRSGGRFTQTRPPADVEPSDGLFVPIEPRWGFQWRGRPRQLPLGGRFWSEYARDIQALIQSWTVSPTRSLVRPPNC
jgi:hypothetical protein